MAFSKTRLRSENWIVRLCFFGLTGWKLPDTERAACLTLDRWYRAYETLYRVCGFPDAPGEKESSSYPGAVEEVLAEAYRAARRLVSQERLEYAAGG